MPDVIYVGRKPLKTYFLKASFELANKGSVSLSARGSLISKMFVVVKRLCDASGCTFSVSEVKFEERPTQDGKRTKIVPTVTVLCKKSV